MTMFVLGLAGWCVAHLMPSVAPGLRGRLMSTVGAGPYKGLFALTIVGSLLLIIFGWRAADPSFVYAEPEWGRIVNMATMLVGFILFVSARLPTNIKRYIRHPQLTAVVLWAVGHLLANGDSRSVILFADGRLGAGLDGHYQSARRGVGETRPGAGGARPRAGRDRRRAVRDPRLVASLHRRDFDLLTF